MVSSQTSRQRVMDAIELATNQIQLASHLQELIDFDYSDLEIEENDDKRRDILKKIGANQMMLNQAISMRRDVMTYIQNKFEEYDKDYRCALKHSLASRGYSQEVYYATGDEGSLGIYLRAKEQLIMVISQFLGLELTKCGRCLEDKLLKTNAK